MGGTLNNIYNNVSFALHLHSEALFRLQEQVSTGSRINRVSDDPTAAYRVLGLNSQKMSLKNYMDNLSQANSALEISLTVVNNMISYIVDGKAHLTQIISGTYGGAGQEGQETRDILAGEINDTLEQMVLLANTRHMDEYLFGGDNTASAPYVVQRSNGEITSVTYQGSYEDRDIEVAPGVESNIFYVGDDIFRSDSRSTPVFYGDTGAAAGTGTSSVTGDVWLTVTGSAGNYDLSIDDGLTTFNTDGTDTNLAVTDSRTGKVLYVDTTGISSTGVDVVSVSGTYDIFNMLISVRDILRNGRGLSNAQLTELQNFSIGSMEEMRSLLVQKSVSMGSKMGFLENLNSTLEDIKFNVEDETVMLQEADIAQIAIDLARREILYQMSLSVGGRLMSMSLLDFI